MGTEYMCQANWPLRLGYETYSAGWDGSKKRVIRAEGGESGEFGIFFGFCYFLVCHTLVSAYNILLMQ
jgi:hypothetical protein